MQIMQFLIGVIYAGLHSFISYSIPIQVLNSSTSPSLSSISSAASSAATAVASTDYGALLKKYIFRAAAEEGLAENVFGANPASQQAHALRQESSAGAPRYHTEYQIVPCVETSGQTFAIWLNVLYLMPLTVLFVRFFIKSYIRRTSKAGGRENRQEQIERAGLDALKGIERELDENENGHGDNVLRELANGHTKANGKANGSAKMNGNSP
jgi:GNS1/SUR4 family